MTYDYKCNSCLHIWEEEQSIKAEALTSCPQCQQETAERLISGGNFILKGDGWASSGYSKK